MLLTKSDGVEFPFDLQRAFVALVSINHLLQLRLADHQVFCSLLVLLHRTSAEQTTGSGTFLPEASTNLKSLLFLTHHFPLLPVQLQHRRQRGGGFGSGPGGWGTVGLWASRDRGLGPQVWILVGLLIIAHVLQAWKRQKR